MLHDTFNIGGRDIYVVESHHYVLAPWAEVRRSLRAPPALLTLDHHTDTHSPFQRYLFRQTGAELGTAANVRRGEMLPPLLTAVDYRDNTSIERAIEKLKNDEHITTALETDILSRAFVVHHMLSHVKHNRIYITRATCAIECQELDHSNCDAKHSAQMLESVYLDRALDDLNAKAQNVGVPAVEAEPYILDIDLDYFHAHSSITPQDTATFYRLVRNAAAITIAKETTYVESCRDNGSTVTSQWLLDQMKQHIAAAMA